MKEITKEDLLNRYTSLKGWLYRNDIVIIERVKDNPDLYLIKNLTNNVIFKLKEKEKNSVIRQLSSINKQKIKINIQKYNIFKSNITNVLLTKLKKELSEKISGTWVKEEKFEKNIANSLVILKKKYLKKGKEKDFLFFNNMKEELEDSYNKWTGSGFNYKLFIYKKI